MHLCYLQHLEQSGHPAFPLIKANMHNLVGEDIELANSSIARITQSQSIRGDISQVCKYYQMMGVYRKVGDEYNEDTHVSRFTPYHREISGSSDEVIAARKFFEDA
jgi:hypothetical protein